MSAKFTIQCYFHYKASNSNSGNIWSVPVSFHHINEIICCGITTQSHISIMDFVLSQNALHSFSIQLTLRALNGQRKLVREQKKTFS